jgi:hypothetical protein
MSPSKEKTPAEKKTVSTQQPKPQTQPQPQPQPQQQPLFYKRVVPLNRERHGELYIETVEGYAFAAETNCIYISAVEFPLSIIEYPIVFATYGQGGVFPVVLLGLKNNQNLFVDHQGKWDASYIPAYARRYPFILATPEPASDKFTVCIDEAYPGFNTAKEGRPLFDDKGEHTAMLTQAVSFLKDYQGHVQMTTEFCKNLVALQVLEPMQANVKLGSGEDLSIGGFQCVKREKLQQLSPGKLADLVKTGQMELIYAHLLSLNNVAKLINKLK